MANITSHVEHYKHTPTPTHTHTHPHTNTPTHTHMCTYVAVYSKYACELQCIRAAKNTHSSLLVGEAQRGETLLHFMEVMLVVPCWHTVVLSLCTHHGRERQVNTKTVNVFANIQVK